MEISLITYDDIWANGTTNPEILGITEGKVYYDLSIKEEDDKLGGMWLIEINENEYVYYRYSKFYKIIRDNT